MDIDDRPFVSVPDEDLHIRVERMNEDDEEARKAFEVLREAKLARNTIYLSEFRQYEPIFRLTGRDEIGDDRFNDLCIEWMNRFSNFDPVRIRDDDTNEIVLEIPPMFNRINPVNVVKEGSDIATAFANACKLPDEFDRKKIMWGSYFERAIRMANPESQLNEARHQAERMTNTLKRQGAIRDPNHVNSNMTMDTPSHTEQIRTNIEDADVEPL